MAIFKQKEFSSLGTKALYGVKQTANKVSSVVKRAPSKSRTAVMRDTIKLRNGIVKATYFPGEVINKGIEFAATKPAAAATAGAWMSTIPYVPGTTTAAATVETVAQKIPAYRKVTERLGNAWKNSKASERIKKVTAEDLNKFIQGMPLLN
jgi:hypothetical protein